MCVELEGIFNSQECCFSFFEEAITHISKRKSNYETRRAKDSENRSTIYR